MKRYAVMMLVALMLFVAVPGFADDPIDPIDPGSLNGSFDILAGAFSLGITPLYSGDVVSLDLASSDGVFNWEIYPEVDGMFIRTVTNSGNISGSFDVFNIDSVDITYDVYSEDFFGFDVDSLNTNVSFDPPANELSNSNNLTVSWDFSDIGSSRFVFKQILATISSDVTGFGVGALKVDETSTYTVAVITLDPSEGEGPGAASRILGVKNLSNLNHDLTLNYTKDEEDFGVMVLIQNWSRNELEIIDSFDTEISSSDMLVDDLNGLSDPQDLMVSFPFFPLRVANSLKIGSGISFGFIPVEDSERETYIPLGNLNSKININFTSPNVTLGINFQEEGSNTGGSSGGCALGFLTPFALLLIAPLLILLKK